jgi:hypothetical protein
MAVRGIVVRASGTIAAINDEIDNPPTGALAQLFNDADGVIHAHLTFRGFYNASSITEVAISRHAGECCWVGSVITSFNP